MIAVIFQVEPLPGHAQTYFDLAQALRPEMEKIDGFISVERFESLSQPGKYLSLSFWRDEAAAAAWHGHTGHQAAQNRGKTEVFGDFRISVAQVLRNYTMAERTGARGRLRDA